MSKKTPGPHKWGIYVHIPYCLQRCYYCDFATVLKEKAGESSEYVSWLVKEIEIFHQRTYNQFALNWQPVSLYFGGGTPSLLETWDLERIIRCIEGIWGPVEKEITVEINPSTLDEKKLKEWLSLGVNRFSVGVQTFDERKLKLLGRKHSPDDSRKTLELLKKHNVNFSLDLLFALPHQNLQELMSDLREIEAWTPPHVSPYILTLRDGHPLEVGRPTESQQADFYTLTQEFLTGLGYWQYEVSNFSFGRRWESTHNQLYWDGSPYFGFGMSSHSYWPFQGWGWRWSNPRSLPDYFRWIRELSDLPESDSSWMQGLANHGGFFEALQVHEAMTDFFYTRLRRMRGFAEEEYFAFFSDLNWQRVRGILTQLRDRGWLEKEGSYWRLTQNGILVSNQIFRELTFLPDDIRVSS